MFAPVPYTTLVYTVLVETYGRQIINSAISHVRWQRPTSDRFHYGISVPFHATAFKYNTFVQVS